MPHMASYPEFLGDVEQHVAAKQVQFRQHQLPQHTCYIYMCRALWVQHLGATLSRDTQGQWFLSKHSYTSLQVLLNWSHSTHAVTSFFSSLLIDSIYCNHLPKDMTGPSLWECTGPCMGDWTYILDVLVYMIHRVPQILKTCIELLWLLDIISLQNFFLTKENTYLTKREMTTK